MNRQRTRFLGLPLALSLALLTILLLAIAASAQAPQGAPRYVSTTGADSGACTNPGAPCGTVQYAVDQAVSGDEVLVATGIYTGVQARAGITQVVYISKTLAVRGGYRADFGAWDPDLYSTTLDAEAAGRVLYATGPGITLTLEGLRVTGGNATGLGGQSWTDTGGGLCVLQANAVVSGNVFLYNVASHTTWGSGGGIHLGYGHLTLVNNEILTNTGGTNDSSWGGGLRLWDGTATIQDNVFQGNVASRRNQGMGGGFDAWYGTAHLEGNVFRHNVGNTGEWGMGGGVHLEWGNATVIDNIFQENWATTASQEGYGGGLYLYGDYAGGGHFTVMGNTIVSNTANTLSSGFGGGLHVTGFNLVVSDNTVEANTAGIGGGIYYSKSPAGTASSIDGNRIRHNTAQQFGGGLYVDISQYGEATLRDNLILDNSAPDGGGVYAHASLYSHSTDWINNVIANNTATGGQGSGLYFAGSSPSATLYHTTLARNGGPNCLYVGAGQVALHNTLFYSHTIGVQNAGGAVTMTQTLWDGVLTPTLGAVAETGSFTGTAALAADGYHLSEPSDAVDAGLFAGVGLDIDGQRRPMGGGPDLGADEVASTLGVYLPLVWKAPPGTPPVR